MTDSGRTRTCIAVHCGQHACVREDYKVRHKYLTRLKAIVDVQSLVEVCKRVEAHLETAEAAGTRSILVELLSLYS